MNSELERLSAKRIIKEIKMMKEEIKKLKEALEQAEGEEEIIRKTTLLFHQTVRPIRRQIRKIKETEVNYVRRGFLFGRKELSDQALEKIRELEYEIEVIKTKMYPQRPYSPGRPLLPSDYCKSQIEFFELAIKRYQEILIPKQKKEDKIAKWKAIAASKGGTSRAIAAAIKKQLDIYELCPYCGQNLGDQPHADHIYPVSKGGLSIESNMVYICNNCNLKKKGMTLNSFIRLYRLDRERIEGVLGDLKKDF